MIITNCHLVKLGDRKPSFKEHGYCLTKSLVCLIFEKKNCCDSIASGARFAKTHLFA